VGQMASAYYHTRSRPKCGRRVSDNGRGGRVRQAADEKRTIGLQSHFTASDATVQGRPLAGQQGRCAAPGCTLPRERLLCGALAGCVRSRESQTARRRRRRRRRGWRGGGPAGLLEEGRKEGGGRGERGRRSGSREKGWPPRDRGLNYGPSIGKCNGTPAGKS